MRVTVLQENLARGLGIVSKAVSPRSTLPVLANILIASDEGRLRLSATNLEMGITCWVPARIEEVGDLWADMLTRPHSLQNIMNRLRQDASQA